MTPSPDPELVDVWGLAGPGGPGNPFLKGTAHSEAVNEAVFERRFNTDYPLSRLANHVAVHWGLIKIMIIIRIANRSFWGSGRPRGPGRPFQKVGGRNPPPFGCHLGAYKVYILLKRFGNGHFGSLDGPWGL